MVINIEVPEPVRRKALAEGEAGRAWLTSLADLVAGLAANWKLTVGRTLTGGTEALAIEARTEEGRDAVLKVNLPARDPAGSQSGTLLAARGRGYAEVYARDPLRGAVLLERLGPTLAALGWTVEAQIEALCATLAEAWSTPLGDLALTSGAEKAEWLRDFIETTWLELERPCSERVMRRAVEYAEARRRAFEPRTAVLAHGDCHPWNALLVPGSNPPRFKFVDPDSLFVEPAYDLGILMREWTDELLAGDPVARGRDRCRRLSELTGVAPEPIWQWGFLERVSTGLLCLRIGLDGGQDMLAVAEAWARALSPAQG
jgi:streptomycin 6-kinase